MQISKKFLAANAVDQTKIRLSNNSYLKARNAADSADVNIIKVNASDRLEFASVPQITADPSSANDAVRKSYVDAVAQGLKPKQAVRVATTAAITIATNLNSGDVIDGVTLANGDRVLVKDQAAQEFNGIYVVSATPSRALDFDSLSPIDEINGAYTFAQEGTANAGKGFVQAGTVAVLDTDPIVFVFFSSAGTLVGQDGITISGSDVSVDHDGQGLQFSGVQLALELDGSTLSKSASGLKVAALGVTSAELAADSVITSKILDANVTVAKLAADSVSTVKIIDANVTAAKLATDSVSTIKIVDANVTAAKLATDSVSTIKIVDANVTNAKIATGIDAAKLADGSVSNAEFQYINTLTSNAQDQIDGKLSNALTSAKVFVGSAGNLAVEQSLSGDATLANTGALTIANSAVTTAKINNDAVDKDKINADVAGNGLGQNVSGALEVNVDDSTIEINTDAIRVKDAGITNAKVATGIDAAKLADGSVSNAEFQYINSLTSNAQTQISGKLDLTGGTMSGAIAMGSNKITGLANGTNAADAVNYAQLQAVSGGLSWKNPILDPDLIDANRAAQPGSPANGDVYIASATAGDWVTGHAYFSMDSGATWTDLLGRVVAIGDRFGVSMESATSAVGALSGQDDSIATITVATPGSVAFSFYAPSAQDGTYVNADLSTHFGHQYTYDGAAWLEFGGISALNAGTGLSIDGNILSVNMGAGIITLPSDEVGVDVHTDGGLMTTVDNSASSTVTAAKLAIKLDSSTLAKSASGLKVASGGITNTEVNASAAIAYSKLALSNSIVNADVNSSAAIAYSKLALSNSVVNADIASGAAIAVNKLAALTANKAVASDASGFLVASSTSDTELGYVAGVTSAIQTQLNAKLTNVLADAKIFVGSAGNLAVAQSMSGDATIDNAGALTIAALAVTSGKLAADSVITSKILDANVTNAKIATGVDAAKIADGSVSNAEFQYINSLTSNAQTQISNRLQHVDSEVLTLDGTDITNQYKDLSFAAYSASSISLVVAGGPMQVRGVDYSVSLTGGVAGVTRINFLGDLASGGAAELVATDILIVGYARL